MTGKFIPFALGCTALLLAACSQTHTPVTAPDGSLPAGSPYAGGKQYPWTDRLDAPGTDPYAKGRKYDWSSPVAASSVKGQVLSDGQNFLSERVYKGSDPVASLRCETQALLVGPDPSPV
ncbi:hypothetical protein [Deinococcus marmoris]|uniref:hypothetical protein n=1 Tax=Deinococcus marmoris TaxID=249408 RepID=UPI00049669D2